MSPLEPQPYAVLLDMAERLAVVVGAGPAALRTIRSLRTHGADILVVAPVIPEEILDMERAGELAAEQRDYRRGDLDGAFMAFAASGSERIDAAVALEARESCILVNVQGDAAASDFIVPSIVARGALQIAVSTGGAAPQVAREVRRGISAAYGPEWEAYTALLSEMRVLAIVRDGLGDAEATQLLESVTASGLLQRLADGESVGAEQLLAEAMAATGIHSRRAEPEDAARLDLLRRRGGLG
jgi:precorrin-2 dehydrogenase/sirohydrochlorin ferrochelatase